MTEPSTSNSMSTTKVRRAARDVYTLAYPLVLMHATKVAQTTVPSASVGNDPQIAGLNTFRHSQDFTAASDKTVVRINVDTLYSMAWLDLSKGPLVLRLPDTGGIFYLMQVMSAWTNVVQAPGTRTNPTPGPQDYVIMRAGTPAPPHFDEAHIITLPTCMGWILGRTAANASTMDAVHRIQRHYQLVPLSLYPDQAAPVEPLVDPDYPRDKTPPDYVDDLSRGDASAFFSIFATLLRDNPLMKGDEAIQDAMNLLGIQPGSPVDWTKLPPSSLDAMANGVKAARREIKSPLAFLKGSVSATSWIYKTRGIGNYADAERGHDDYLTRAAIAYRGLGANLPEDAVYPASLVQLNLQGRASYTITFEEAPPVNPQAFWSLTAYDEDGYLLDNEHKVHSINSLNNPQMGAGGPFTLSIGPNRPSQPPNVPGHDWLPTDANKGLTLMLRLYWPDRAILDGSWQPPDIVMA